MDTYRFLFEAPGVARFPVGLKVFFVTKKTFLVEAEDILHVLFFNKIFGSVAMKKRRMDDPSH